ncbi:MAG: O-antigen ligase family protein [bacterium]
MKIDSILSPMKKCSMFVCAAGLAFSLALANIGIMLLLIVVILEYYFHKKQFAYKKQAIEFSFITGLAVYAVSSIFGLQPLYSLSRFHSELLFITLYVYVYGLNEKEGLTCLKIFALFTAAAALFGLIQYTIGIDVSLQGNLTNIPSWLISFPDGVLHELALKQGRVMSSRSHPITYAEAAFFGLIIMITFVIIEKHAVKRIGWIAASLISVTAIILSSSRGAWLAMAAGIPVLLMVKKKKIIRVRYISIAVACIAVLMFLIPSVRGRILSLDMGSKESNRVRISLWKTGINILQDYPLLGIGPHTLKSIYDQYQDPGIPDKRRWSELHNQYIQVAAERGIIGFGVYLWMLVCMGMMWYYAWKNQIWSLRGQMAAAGLACFAGFLIMCLTENAFFDSEINLILWFILGITGSGNE